MKRFLSLAAAATGLWVTAATLPAAADSRSAPPSLVASSDINGQWGFGQSGDAAPRAPVRVAQIWHNRGLFSSSSRERSMTPERSRSTTRAPRIARPPSSSRYNRVLYTRPAAPARPAARHRKQAPRRSMDPAFLPSVVPYSGPQAPGTIIIDTPSRYLYLVQGDGTARRYGVGVGRPGFQWAGEHAITRKAKWPGWTPPKAMRQRQPGLPVHMVGGPNNPLGARALYLGSTLYRIHGSNQPWTIGHAVSSGCIRMRNEDVKDLYRRVDVGTKVIVN